MGRGVPGQGVAPPKSGEAAEVHFKRHPLAARFNGDCRKVCVMYETALPDLLQSSLNIPRCRSPGATDTQLGRVRTASRSDRAPVRVDGIRNVLELVISRKPNRVWRDQWGPDRTSANLDITFSASVRA